MKLYIVVVEVNYVDSTIEHICGAFSSLEKAQLVVESASYTNPHVQEIEFDGLTEKPSILVSYPVLNYSNYWVSGSAEKIKPMIIWKLYSDPLLLKEDINRRICVKCDLDTDSCTCESPRTYIFQVMTPTIDINYTLPQYRDCMAYPSISLYHPRPQKLIYIHNNTTQLYDQDGTPNYWGDYGPNEAGLCNKCGRTPYDPNYQNDDGYSYCCRYCLESCLLLERELSCSM